MEVSERVSTSREVSTGTMDALSAEQVNLSPSSVAVSFWETSGGDAVTRRGVVQSSRCKLKATGAKYTISLEVVERRR
jgi:hypothetical protein